MATVLRGQLKRAVKVYGVPGDVTVVLTAEGLEFKTKGTRVGVMLSWLNAVKASGTPLNAPSKFYGKPLEFLQAASDRATARLVKKLEAEAEEKHGKLESN
jgi:hypothetical protein